MPAYSALSISSIFIRDICLCLRATTLFPCNFYRIGFRYKVHSMAGHYSWSRCSERNELFRLNRRLDGRRAAFVRGKWKAESVKRSGMQTRKDSRRTSPYSPLRHLPLVTFAMVRRSRSARLQTIFEIERDKHIVRPCKSPKPVTQEYRGYRLTAFSILFGRVTCINVTVLYDRVRYIGVSVGH